MENTGGGGGGGGGLKKEEEKMGLPPGFRFHPTDEELITHYLNKKAVDGGFSSTAITEVDLNKSEPWELPWKAKMGEKEWYFFCVRDRKYPTGLRTNRATKAGYWKATGKDKPILRGKGLVGMKKTLVFYEGRAPRGQKTSWVMHEFRHEGKFAFHGIPPAIQNEWVICRVFQKSSSGKKVHVSGMMKMVSLATDARAGILTPPRQNLCTTSENLQFFTPSIDLPASQHSQIDTVGGGYNFPLSSIPCVPLHAQSHPRVPENWQINGWLQEQTYLKAMIDNQLQQEREMGSISQEPGSSMVENTEISTVMERRPFENGGGEHPSLSVDFDCLWNY